MMFCLVGFSQVRPDQFPVKTIPVASDEIYSQAGGTSPVRITFADALKYFGFDVVTATTGYTPSSTGNTQNLNDIITASDGNIYAIDWNGDAKRLNPSSGGISDGDKGDITVSSSGSVWSIDNNAVTLDDMAGSTANTLLGYDGSGNPTEVAVGTGLSLSGATLTATGGGGSAVAYDNLTIDGMSVSITRLGGTAASISGDNEGYTLTLTSGTEILGIVIEGNSTNTTSGTGDFLLDIDNSANSRDRFFMVQVFTRPNGSLFDAVTNSLPTLTASGNVTSLVVAGADGFGSNGSRIILK